MDTIGVQPSIRPTTRNPGPHVEAAEPSFVEAAKTFFSNYGYWDDKEIGPAKEEILQKLGLDHHPNGAQVTFAFDREDGNALKSVSSLNASADTGRNTDSLPLRFGAKNGEMIVLGRVSDTGTSAEEEIAIIFSQSGEMRAVWSKRNNIPSEGTERKGIGRNGKVSFEPVELNTEGIRKLEEKTGISFQPSGSTFEALPEFELVALAAQRSRI